jgi:hypothetical protein
MALFGARPKGAGQATGRGPGSADANPHDAYVAAAMVKLPCRQPPGGVLMVRRRIFMPAT